MATGLFWCPEDRLAAKVQQVRGGTKMKANIGARLLLGAVLVATVWPFRPSLAAGHDFKICTGRFALCAASTCKATGKFITVNVASGGTATFPEYDCTCPVLSGPGIADLSGGNMQGSCEPPPNQIWSYYQPRK